MQANNNPCNCSEEAKVRLSELIYPFIDGQLDAEQQNEFLALVQKCDACFSYFEDEKAFLNCVKEDCQCKKLNIQPDVAERIRTSIMALNR